jgi:ComF family protein
LPSVNYKQLLLRIGCSFVEAVFPTKCLACGSFFNLEDKVNARNQKGLKSVSQLSWENQMPRFFCRKCIVGFTPVASPMCLRCGIMFVSRKGPDHVCGTCITLPGNFRMARSAGVYETALMEAIHCLKYKGKRQLMGPLGAILFSTFIRHWKTKDIDMVIPVPLHIKRFKKRGFNQAYLLIRNWPKIAKSVNVSFSDVNICKDILVRQTSTDPQTGLNRKKRMANVKHAFSLKRSSDVKGKRILLVDDVLTTGATADACAHILMRGGAACVDVLTLAQTL